jgi:hypothetical protein
MASLALAGKPQSVDSVSVSGDTGEESSMSTTTGRPERFFTKLEQTHARNFLKETVEHVLLANPKPCVKHLPNICLVKNP